MSIISLLLSSKEVILSLVVIGLILFFIVILAVMPGLQRRWQKRVARKQAKKAAAELARKKKNQLNKQRALAAAKKRALEAAMEQIAPVEDDIDTVSVPNQDSEISPAENASETTPETGAVETVEATEEAESESASSLQNMLDSVFIDEDADLRFQNLLNGTEPISAQALTELADNILSRFTASDEIKEGA